MRITVGRLKKLIEATWKASAPPRFNLPDVTVDAESSVEAGKKAAAEYGKQGHRGIDPMTISVAQTNDRSSPPMHSDDSTPASDLSPDDIAEGVAEYIRDELPPHNWNDILNQFPPDVQQAIMEAISDLHNTRDELSGSSWKFEAAERYVREVRSLNDLIGEIMEPLL